MDFLTLAHERFSCRKFSDVPVEQEKIDKIIDVAMAAPTAHNCQPIKIWMIRSDEAKERLAQATPVAFVKKASVVFVVGGDPSQAWIREPDHKNYCEIDASIVTTHMMLEACDLGLGSTWVGRFDADKVKDLFPEMKDHNLVALLSVGYPAEDVVPFKTHNMSKPKEELVAEL